MPPAESRHFLASTCNAPTDRARISGRPAVDIADACQAAVDTLATYRRTNADSRTAFIEVIGEESWLWAMHASNAPDARAAMNEVTDALEGIKGQLATIIHLD